METVPLEHHLRMVMGCLGVCLHNYHRSYILLQGFFCGLISNPGQANVVLLEHLLLVWKSTGSARLHGHGTHWISISMSIEPIAIMIKCLRLIHFIRSVLGKSKIGNPNILWVCCNSDVEQKANLVCEYFSNNFGPRHLDPWRPLVSRWWIGANLSPNIHV